VKTCVARAVILVSCYLCGLAVGAESSAVDEARQHGAQGKVTLRVVDSKGNPVGQAHLSLGLFPTDTYASVDVREGRTDSDGLFVVEGKTVADMAYGVKKDGHYGTTGKYWFYRQGEECVVSGRWQPWNPTVAIVLKELRKPVSMYAKQVYIAIPVQGTPVGFDLEKGDWVAPHGQGSRSDLLVQYVATYENPPVFSKRLEMAFSNAQDGVQALPLDVTSEFVSAYAAPESGYAPRIVLESERPRTGTIRNQDIGDNRYLVFRVRTATDKDGRITRANYGKIYGPINYGRMGETHCLMFSYYFNPTVNDPNLEFDPSQNLFGQTDRQRVYKP